MLFRSKCQVRVDDSLKESSDSLFSSLGLDTSTAIRMFLVASREISGIPFDIRLSKKQPQNDWSNNYKNSVLNFQSTPDPTFQEPTEITL